MPKRQRRQRHKTKRSRNDKATLPKWIEWLVSRLLDAFKQQLVGALCLFLLSVVPHSHNDYSWLAPQEEIKVQYYKI